jgi:predicted RNA-binding Zn ribbon-like protein
MPVSPGVDGALGTPVAAAVVAMWDGTWSRLKACPRDCCHSAFYDRSFSGSATGCSMAVCGGRVKANTYYRRRREDVARG